MKKSVIYGIMSLATMSGFALEGCSPWQMCGEQLSHAPSIQPDMHLQASEEQPSHVPCIPEEEPWDLDFFLEGYNPWQMCEEQPSRASCMQPDMPLQASEEEDPSLADAEHDSLMERRIRRMERRTGRMERRTGRMERRTERMERRTGRMERRTGRMERRTERMERRTGRMECEELHLIRHPEMFGIDSFMQNIELRYESFSRLVVRIPGTATHIPELAFAGIPQLVAVSFDNGCEEIGDCAFAGTGLEEVWLPQSIQKLGQGCFSFCPNLKRVYIRSDSPLKTIGEGIFRDTPLEFFGNENNLPMFPHACRATGAFLFYSSNLYPIFSTCKIRCIMIPKAVTEISACAFMNCKELECVEFEPESTLSVIGPQAFAETPALTFFGIKGANGNMLPFNQLRVIDDRAFANSGIKQFVVATNIEIIGGRAFSICENLETFIWIPHHSECSPCYIGERAFSYSGLKSYVLPPTVIALGEMCFMGCKEMESFATERMMSFETNDMDMFVKKHKDLKDQNLLMEYPSLATEYPSLVTECPELAYEHLALVYIPEKTFANCEQLRVVDLSGYSQVRRLGEAMFEDSEALTKIYLPESLRIIEDECFPGDTPVKVEFPHTAPEKIWIGTKNDSIAESIGCHKAIIRDLPERNRAVDSAPGILLSYQVAPIDIIQAMRIRPTSETSIFLENSRNKQIPLTPAQKEFLQDIHNGDFREVQLTNGILELISQAILQESFAPTDEQRIIIQAIMEHTLPLTDQQNEFRQKIGACCSDLSNEAKLFLTALQAGYIELTPAQVEAILELIR